jgi:hypothetical protein
MTAIAEVLPMPGVRQIVIRRLPLERRKELLRQLALDYRDLEPEVVELQLTALAHDSHTGPEMKAAWLDYRHRVYLSEGISEGVIDWRDICEDLTCGERTAAAREIAHGDAEEALHHLAAGRP